MLYDIKQGNDNLTYVEHYPPCRASALGYVYSVRVGRIWNDGEDFTLKTDWRTMIVL